MQAVQQGELDPQQGFEQPQSQVEPTQPVKPEPQLVQMSRAELELYVREGRPTGLLLRSIALLKGMSRDSIAQASGIPGALVQAIFDEHCISSIKKNAIRRIASVLGIDLTVMRLAAGQVHVFDLSKAPGRFGGKDAQQAVRAVGLLARGALVAELKVGTGWKAFRWRGKMHVAARDNFRAVFVGAGGKRFGLSMIPSASWACKGKREHSLVPVRNEELAHLLVRRDLTEGEFDELFQGANALSWDDVRAASRINGVSKRELMAFIQSRASELDESEVQAAKRAVIEDRPILRLVVENEPRAASA